MEYDIPYPTYIPYIGPNNAPLGVKCQGRVVTCFRGTARLHVRGHWELVGTTVSKYYVTCHNGLTCGIRSRMLLNADGNSTNTVIQFNAMCLLLSIARMWPSSHLRTR